MSSHQQDVLDPTQPALIVLYGNTSRRWRPLTGDLLVVGRTPRCDVGLDSPDIASVHCLLIRRGDGWHIRDCGSRAGTRRNGKMVHESRLHDGDILQVGTFSFEIHLPAERRADANGIGGRERPAHSLERLLHSRRRLVRLAIALRRRFRQLQMLRKYPPTEQGLQQREADLNKQATQLQECVRDIELRTARVEERERELALDRETLGAEYAAFQQRTERAEAELSRRQAEVEADLRARWKQCEEQYRTFERAQARAELAEDRRRMELRRQELDHFARHLVRANEQLIKQHLEAATRLQEIQSLREENERLRRLHDPRPDSQSTSDAEPPSTGLSAELTAWQAQNGRNDTYFPNGAPESAPLELRPVS